MKKIIAFSLFIFLGHSAFAQKTDYRTAEDGINQLLSNPKFIEDAINMGTSDLTAEKLNEYFTKYVPEYSNFKIGNSKIDFNKIYYANAEGTSTDKLASILGNTLKLNPAQTQNLKNTFSGNLNYSPTSNLSTGLGNKLYERGKDAKVDYAVDYAVDFFQNKLGDGGLNSALIDIGGGLLGNLALALNESISKKQQQKMEVAAREARLTLDYTIYNYGYTGAITPKAENSDLISHSKAKQNMPGIYAMFVENTNYDKAIELLDKAIEKYKQNPDRAYYLYAAYTDRALCKMQIAAYRAAIIDYYFAQKILEGILDGKLPDNSVEKIYPKGYFDASNKTTYMKGKTESKIGCLNKKDLVNIILNRAFAKYRAEDYNGAISDAQLAVQTLVKNNIASTATPNDYKDISQAIVAMSQFGLAQYKESYNSFLKANLNDDMSKDTDKDGITDFTDRYDNTSIHPEVPRESKLTIFYGFPNYFPFDIIQIRGLSYYKEGKMSEAIKMYENIVSAEGGKFGYQKTFTKVGGDIAALYASLASFYFAKGDTKKSISLLDNAISINPDQLEYYYKRGAYKKANNQLQESEKDFNIVKNPALLKESSTLLKESNTVESFNYYQTKYQQAIAANNKKEKFNVIKEAIRAFPDGEINTMMYFPWAIMYLTETKSSSEADEISLLVIKNSKQYHILKSLHYSFSSNTQMEEREMNLAFQKGANFYTTNAMLPDLRLREKKYYCKLFTQFASKTNNNFIPENFDAERMKKSLDSTYSALSEQYKGNKQVRELMEAQRKTEIAKNSGNYEEYLAILNSNKMLLETSPTHALDKIECLLLLNRKEEAIAFAKKVISQGKLPKSQDESINPNAKFYNVYYYAIENMASGVCE